MTDSRVFTRLDDYEFEEFVRDALPALEAIDPQRLLELLAKKLSRAVDVSSDARSEVHPGWTISWCRHLDHPDPADGARAQLACVVAGVASRVATSPTGTARVFEVLERFPGEIFERIALFVLARSGHFAVDRVDAFFRAVTSIEPNFKGREVAEVVREQFGNASESARAVFEARLREGPQGDLRQTDATEFEERMRHWQRRRLLWFRDRLPESLRHLAGTLGVTGERPGPREQALAEDGFFVDGGFVGERSPASVETLAALSADEFIQFVQTWQPEFGSLDSPTREGLRRSLTDYAKAHPVEAVQRASVLLGNGELSTAIPGYIQALLAGLRGLADSGATPNGAALFDLLGLISMRLEPFLIAEPRDSTNRHWRWLATEVVDITIALARRNVAGPEQMEILKRIVGTTITSPSTWIATADQPLRSLEDVLMAALNTSAGRSMEALLEVALASFRLELGIPESQANVDQLREAKSRVSGFLRPLLAHALAQTGRGAVAAQAVIGTYVPQIHFLDRDWLMEVAPALFTNGAQPLEHPAWGAYVVRANWYRVVFSDLKEWYLAAAERLEQTTSEDERIQQWSISQHLGEHVFHAYLRGLVDVSDADPLMALVFGRIPGVERAHLAWQVYRGWTDAPQPPPPEFVRRLVSFWRWRLDELETAQASANTVAELRGLTWLICTPHIPREVALELGLRTVMASRGAAQARNAVWEALGELSDSDVDRSFQIAELLIDAALQKPYPHVSVSDVEKVFRAAMARGTLDTQSRATRLIHRLGDLGFLDFGRLLAPERAE